MIEIAKLHFKNKQHALILVVTVFLIITTLLTTLQIALGNTRHIKISMITLGGIVGLIGPFLALSRGRNGEGKFLSRLPVSRYKVFFGKVLFLIIFYVILTLSLFVGTWVIAGIVKLLGSPIHIADTPTLETLLRDGIKFIKTMPFFLFLGALSLWLQKWAKSNQANLLVVLGLVVVFGLIPLITVLTLQHHSLTISSGEMTAYLNAYGTPVIVTINLILFFAAMGLYRLRHFRIF